MKNYYVGVIRIDIFWEGRDVLKGWRGGCQSSNPGMFFVVKILKSLRPQRLCVHTSNSPGVGLHSTSGPAVAHGSFLPSLSGSILLCLILLPPDSELSFTFLICATLSPETFFWPTHWREYVSDALSWICFLDYLYQMIGWNSFCLLAALVLYCFLQRVFHNSGKIWSCFKLLHFHICIYYETLKKFET